MKYLIILLFAVSILSCGKTSKLSGKNATPACVQQLIDSAMANTKGALFTKVEAYDYQDKKVYVYTPGCCDRYSEVKDENCVYLFAPSGGMTGKGDGKHPNFFTEAKLIKVVWEDTRQ